MFQDFKFKLNLKYFQTKLIYLTHLYGGLTLFISGLIMNLFQAILYVTIRPFSKNWFRKINKYICASMYAQVIFPSEWISSAELRIYADSNDFEKYYGKEHSFCIINHTYEIDWLINWMFCNKIGCLGNFKACSKKDAKWLPTFGWSWIFADFLFLERSFEKDQITIIRQITELVNHPEPIWLTFYPEGTRLTPEKHALSIKFSRANGLPEYKHHMLPRTKGFLACLPLMVGKVGGLYDFVLAFEGGKNFKPNYQQIANGDKIIAHIYIRRIPFENVPQEPKEAAKFLYKMFERKDRLLDSFYKTGDFFAESGIERLPPIKYGRGYTSLINFLIWNFILTLPMMWYWISFLYYEEYINFCLILCILLTAFWATNKSIDYSSLKTASNYGMGVPK